jgi:hypothetical protein
MQLSPSLASAFGNVAGHPDALISVGPYGNSLEVRETAGVCRAQRGALVWRGVIEAVQALTPETWCDFILRHPGDQKRMREGKHHRSDE